MIAEVVAEIHAFLFKFYQNVGITTYWHAVEIPQNMINPLALALDIYSSAHHLCKM